jgi:glycosyltransferase involved in cell wall biosynthesis
MHKSLKSTEVAYYLSMIDAGFVLRKNSLVNINSSPTKSSEYLAAGAMIITTQYAGDSPELVRKSGCGVVLEDVRALTKNELQELDSKITAYVEDYSLNAHKAKEYVFKNRSWSFNEEKLKMLYAEI